MGNEQAMTTTGNTALTTGLEVLDCMADYLRLNVAEGDASENTIAAYVTHVWAFASWCYDEGTDPARATERDVIEYRRELIRLGYKRSTMGVKLSAVRRFFEAAIWHGLRSDNPAAGGKPPRDHTTKRDRIIQRYLSPEEVQRLLTAPPWTPPGIRDRAMIAIMYYHGLRVSEVAALQVNSLIPGGNRQLAIVAGKGSKDRNVFLVPKTAELIDRWLQERPALAAPDCDSLFVSNSNNGAGTTLTTAGIRYRVNGYLNKLGLYRNGCSCHALRHAHGSHAVAAGADIATLAHEMGHSSITTTGVYTHIVNAIQQNPGRLIADAEQEN